MRPTLLFHQFCLLLLVAVPVLTGSSYCDSHSTVNPVAEAESTVFKKNLELWQSKNITNYRYTLKESCYCPLQYLGPNKIEVRRDKAVAITYIGEGKNIDMK